MIAGMGAVVLLLSALLPRGDARLRASGRALAVLGALALLPSVGSSGSWPFILLAGGAAALATPLPLVLASAGAARVALLPEASAPLAAAVAGLAVAVAADSVVSSVRERRGGGADTLEATLAAGVCLLSALALMDHGAVLHWTFGIEGTGGHVLLPGVGPLLGVSLMSGLGGVLLLAGARLAPEAAGARPLGVAVLAAAAVAGALGTGLAVVRVAALAGGVAEGGGRSVAVLVAAVGTLAACLLERNGAASSDLDRSRGSTTTRVAAGLAVVAAAAAGGESWWRDGTYVTPLTMTAATGALLGLAALEPDAPLGGTRRLLLLLALLSLLG